MRDVGQHWRPAKTFWKFWGRIRVGNDVHYIASTTGESCETKCKWNRCALRQRVMYTHTGTGRPAGSGWSWRLKASTGWSSASGGGVAGGRFRRRGSGGFSIEFFWQRASSVTSNIAILTLITIYNEAVICFVNGPQPLAYYRMRLRCYSTKKRSKLGLNMGLFWPISFKRVAVNVTRGKSSYIYVCIHQQCNPFRPFTLVHTCSHLGLDFIPRVYALQVYQVPKPAKLNTNFLVSKNTQKNTSFLLTRAR